MTLAGFNEAVGWIREERDSYQTKKFDYAKEAERYGDVGYWMQQFGSYEQRIEVFGLDNPLGVQAALKLAATTLALCEHLADREQLPQTGTFQRGDPMAIWHSLAGGRIGGNDGRNLGNQERRRRR